MKLFNKELEEQLKDVFSNLVDDVNILLFTDNNCDSCAATIDFVDEIEALSDKIHLEKYTLSDNADLADKYNVKLAPSLVLLDAKRNYLGIKFNGVPAGHEINSFISTILEVSGAQKGLPESIVARIKAIDKPVNIKVFVTLTCPHCPGAVQTANKLALMNENIEAEMIEAQTFRDLSSRFKVSSVPKIVINDKYELVGNQPIQEFLNTIESM
ncbi:protein disulfide oxidoreductase [Clostridium saccharoperbutylacetonicum]